MILILPICSEMSHSCPNSCAFWRPATDFFCSSRFLCSESGSFHNHRFSFKEDPRTFRIRRRGHRKQIHGFHAQGKQIDDFEIAEIQSVTSDCHIGYKVKEGDTLTAIANKFNTKLHSIALANKIVDVHYIPAGKLLLIPLQSINSDQVHRKSHQSSVVISNNIEDEVDNVIMQSENNPVNFPKRTSAPFFQVYDVRVASSVLVLLAVFYLVRKCISYFDAPKPQEIVFHNLRDAESQSRIRRWEGILKEDEKLDEANMAAFPEEQNISELEDEKLEESYAKLESVYMQFLADSGLSTSGYWRGGAPVASDKD